MTDTEKTPNDEQMTSDEIIRLQEALEEHNTSPARFIAIPSFFVMLLGIGALITPFAIDFIFAAIRCWPTGDQVTVALSEKVRTIVGIKKVILKNELCD